MKRRILAALIGLAALVGVTLVAATPAHASFDDCYQARVYCVWTSQSANGFPSYYWTIPTGSGGYCVNYGGSLNDNVDANRIRGGRSATQYRHANCSGSTISTITTDQSGQCGGITAWACYWEGIGSYLPSSAWIIK